MQVILLVNEGKREQPRIYLLKVKQDKGEPQQDYVTKFNKEMSQNTDRRGKLEGGFNGLHGMGELLPTKLLFSLSK